jgi:hypothetical protein
LGMKWRGEERGVLCMRVLTISRGCTMRVAIVPAERPAMVSTRAGERPASLVFVMGDGSIVIAATLSRTAWRPRWSTVVSTPRAVVLMFDDDGCDGAKKKVQWDGPRPALAGQGRSHPSQLR